MPSRNAVKHIVTLLTSSQVIEDHSFKLSMRQLRIGVLRLVLGVSSAQLFSPESDGEAENAVKKVKLTIEHTNDKLEKISAAVGNLNYDWRLKGLGSAAKLFLERTLRVSCLTHIPSHVHIN